MTRYVAFLRAINVGGHTVKMDRLRREFVALGLDEVETFIASGNVMFDARARGVSALERRIEKRLESQLGFEVKTFIRTDAQVRQIAEAQPFPAGAVNAARRFWVGFIGKPLTAAALKALHELENGDESFHADGQQVYWLSRVGTQESKFSGNVFERKVGTPVTFRNMNTLRRLAAKL